MTKQIRLNAFDMNCVAHQSSGMWRHPRDRSWTYKDLEYWVDLARVLERGKFDGIFLADVLGVYDVYGGSAEAALRNATQIPVNDPFLVIPAMAVVTENLGFGVTGTLSYEAPFQFARRMSTLDHLTKGRIGWNIVTGYLESAAKGAGRDKQSGHDLRYDIADEYMQIVYKLWEGSWDEGAVVRDRDAGIFTQANRVRKIEHKGEHYTVNAIHLSEPSPQRTPVLYQAGTSGKGREFAARHAECVFMAAPTKQIIAGSVADIRKRAAAHGRNPSEILIFALATVIPGATDEAARAKLAEYQSYVSPEGALALVSGWTGIDFSKYALDDVVRYIENDAIRSTVETLTVADPDRQWTIRQIAEFAGIGGMAPVIVGSPDKVADELMSWVRDTDVDGFNLAYAVTPESFTDFVDLVVPELQRRGVYKREYAPGTFREKLFGQGRARLGKDHPAHLYRHSGL
jgi:FMN-dependent oxidoreductase (nitrilotriacetate monooxygenase family)